MKNYWLDRIRKREEDKVKDDQSKGKFIFPPTLPPALWKLANRRMKKAKP